MKKVIILRGLPASGKSTYAKELSLKNPGQYKIVNKDSLREMLDAGKWSKDNEKFVLQMRDHVILNALEEGKHVIVDDTNLHPKHETNIRELVKGKAEIEIKDFGTPVDDCIERDLKRARPVGEAVIRKMHRQFLWKPETYIPPKDKPYALICDLDGTLAKMKNRGPFEWDKVGTDELNESVKYMIDGANNKGDRIVIVSGRDGSCEEITRDWLRRNAVPYHQLFMRPAGNTEKDSVIKRRIFEEHIREKYHVYAVLDDRDQVVEMWRSLGLTCLQVGYGDF